MGLPLEYAACFFEDNAAGREILGALFIGNSLYLQVLDKIVLLERTGQDRFEAMLVN